MASKVLERSERNRVLSGVFGGLGEYLNVDPNLLRIVGVFLLLAAPVVMVIVYAAAALILPKRGGVAYISGQVDANKLWPVIVGVALVIIGLGLMGGSPFTIAGFPFLAAAFQWTVGLVIAAVGALFLVDQLRKI